MAKDTLCLAPFVSVYKNYIGVTACCEMPGEDGKGLPSTVEEYLESDFYKELCTSLKNFDMDSLPKQCKLCLTSDRPHAELYEEKSSPGMYNNVDLDSFKMTKLTLGQSNKCNASCRMCGPEFSNSKSKLWDKLGFDNAYESEDLLKTDHEYDLDLIKRYDGELKEIVIHGGDPTQFDTTPELLDTLLAQKSPVKASLLTNGSFNTMTDGRNIFEVLDNFHEVSIMFSIDSIPGVNDYIRSGNNTKRTVKLIKEALAKMTKTDLTITVHVTLTNYSIMYYSEFLDWFDKELAPLGVLLSTGLVRFPRMYAPGNLPDDLKREVFQKLREKKDGRHATDINLAMKDMLKFKFDQAEWDKVVFQNQMQDKEQGKDGSEFFPRFTSNIIPVKSI